MRILIACETSGALRKRFREAGHHCWSVDLLPADDPKAYYHLQEDALRAAYGGRWDMMIAHPPCTYLCSSGLHWNHRTPGRAEKTEEALAFVRALMAAPIPRIAIENPVGAIGTRIRPADQYVQPYEFGDDASKRTGLWLKNLPKLEAKPLQRFPGRWVTLPSGKRVERWSNQTDSGQNRLGPSADRWQVRSKTYDGIARAMVEQWGDL